MNYQQKMKKYAEMAGAANKVAIVLEESGLELPDEVSEALREWQQKKGQFQLKDVMPDARLSA